MIAGEMLLPADGDQQFCVWFGGQALVLQNTEMDMVYQS